jgi:hypothetical protein
LQTFFPSTTTYHSFLAKEIQGHEYNNTCIRLRDALRTRCHRLLSLLKQRMSERIGGFRFAASRIRVLRSTMVSASSSQLIGVIWLIAECASYCSCSLILRH